MNEDNPTSHIPVKENKKYVQCYWPDCEEEKEYDAEVVSCSDPDGPDFDIGLCLKHYVYVLRYSNDPDLQEYEEMLKAREEEKSKKNNSQ